MFFRPRPALRDCGVKSFSILTWFGEKGPLLVQYTPLLLRRTIKNLFIPFGHISFFILVEVARIELASKEETYFRLRDVVHLDTIPL